MDEGKLTQSFYDPLCRDVFRLSHQFTMTGMFQNMESSAVTYLGRASLKNHLAIHRVIQIFFNTESFLYEPADGFEQKSFKKHALARICEEVCAHA